MAFSGPRRRASSRGRRGPSASTRGASAGEFLETGIKAVDLLAPLCRGGRLGIGGDPGAGKLVLIQELVHRLAKRAGGAALFGFVAAREIAFSRAVAAGTLASNTPELESFYLLTGDQDDLDPSLREELDGHVSVSRVVARRGIYPAIDASTSWSRLSDAAAPGAAHREVAAHVRAALQELPMNQIPAAGSDRAAASARAAKLALFLSQPFYVAEAHTGSPGVWVPLSETLSGCDAILQGEVDDMPVEAFRFTGTLAEARARWQARPGSPDSP